MRLSDNEKLQEMPYESKVLCECCNTWHYRQDCIFYSDMWFCDIYCFIEALEIDPEVIMILKDYIDKIK